MHKFEYRTPVVLNDNTYKEQVLHQLAVLRTEIGYISIQLEDWGHLMPKGVAGKIRRYVYRSKELLFHAYNMVELFDEPPDDGRYIRHSVSPELRGPTGTVPEQKDTQEKKGDVERCNCNEHHEQKCDICDNPQEEVGDAHDGAAPLDKPWLKDLVEETLNYADANKAIQALGCLVLRLEAQEKEHERLRQQYQETNNKYVEHNRSLASLLTTIKYILGSMSEETQTEAIRKAIRTFEVNEIARRS